jgi:DUF4097 and DUF4098 domain-containing protein YvlB
VNRNQSFRSDASKDTSFLNQKGIAVSNTHKSLIIALVLLITASLGCNTTFGVSPFTAEETITQSFESGASPRVVVETFNGKIEITTDTGNTVQVSVTKRGSGNSQADAQDDLKNIEVPMTQESGTIRVIARRIIQKTTTGNSGASASIKIPKGTTLELRSSNGGITVTGPTGDVTANTSNGRIEIRGSVGRLRLDTSNGNIEVEAENVVVAARTSNGRIEFKGSLAPGDHSFRTSNGQITLTLLSNAGFKFDAQTSNGKVTSEFPVSRTGGSRESELRGTVGENPAISIELHTSNGGIEIRKGQ